jgi:hypothetical protein
MVFRQPTLRSRKRMFFTDQGTMRPDPDCDDNCAEGKDAGRIRFAKAPEQNHYAGGEFRDVQNPDGQSERTEAEWTDPRVASGGEGRAYAGMRRGAPRATQSNPGQLGTGVVEAPWTSNREIGLSGTAAFDPAKNLSTVGKDPDVMFSTSARGGVGALQPDGMGSRATEDAKRLRAINRANRKAYGLDADPDDVEEKGTNESPGEPITPPPEEKGPAVTRHTLERPDGSKIIQTHELHHPPPPTMHVNTVDPRNPRRRPVLSGTQDTAGTKFGTLRAERVRSGVNTIAEINRLNREKWGK